MPTIQQTPTGTWKAVVRRKGWPIAAKTFRLKRDAEDWARRTEDEMVRGLYIHRAPSEKLVLSEALDRYLKEVTVRKAAGTRAGDKTVAKVLKSKLGRYALIAMTPDLVAGYRDGRLATVSQRTGRLITANTVRVELALLSHLFNVAIREWQIGLITNPVAQIEKPNPGSGRKRRLNWKEYMRLMRECRCYANPMLYQIVRVALYTGMRRGEILGLRRQDVDLARRVVHLTQTKNGEPRTVPLSPRAARVLRQALDNPVRPLGTDLIFWGEPGRKGDRRRYVYEPAWQRAVKRAKLEDFHFHDLRHEFVSRLIEFSDLSDVQVATIIGHKTMDMVLRYAHLRAGRLVEKLDRRPDREAV